MKLRQVLLGLGATLALSGVAQPTVMNSDAQAFLERGRLMYESRNYVGAIDQLSHMLQLPCTTDMEEEAELLIAMSSFERGESQSLDLLITFVEEHPTSPRAQLAQEKIGNYYFYRGDWKNALLSYSLVRERALNADMDENVMYRIAYCHLRLGEWDQARTLYERLARTKRYGSATDFYNAYIDYAQGDYDEAIAEAKAQIEYCENRGMQPSHVASHMGALYGLNGKLLMLPKTLALGGKKGYPFRMFSKPLASQCPEEAPLWLFKAVCRFSGLFGKLYHVPMPDYLIFPEKIATGKTYEEFKNNFIEYLIRIPEGICETYIHPALPTEEMKSITGTWQRRYWEYLVMKDPETHAAFKTHGVHLISYRDLTEMKR